MKNPTKPIIVAILVCTIVSICFIYTVSAQNTLVRAEASTSQPRVGDTLTVNIKISDAQDLFGVDVTLNWNSSTLKLVSATPQLGVESHSGGVLHESSSFPIEVADNTASQSDGKYHLLATSTGSSTPAFTGSGTIATVTFTVTSIGSTGLALEDVELSELAADRTVNLVTPSTSVDSVTPVASTVSPTPVIPEFPTTLILLLVALATATLAISTKLLKKRTSASLKTASKF
ncbi:MAG: cohesin domain-containing protein [Candidatus Bathyarchaeota archaeon]|nr:cohesin domain-containing protein [Candidatus Bathyarchaeota archaeon]